MLCLNNEIWSVYLLAPKVSARCELACLALIERFFLVAVAIVRRAEVSPLKFGALLSDGLEGLFWGLVEGAAGAERQG